MAQSSSTPSTPYKTISTAKCKRKLRTFWKILADCGVRNFVVSSLPWFNSFVFFSSSFECGCVWIFFSVPRIYSTTLLLFFNCIISKVTIKSNETHQNREWVELNGTVLFNSVDWTVSVVVCLIMVKQWPLSIKWSRFQIVKTVIFQQRFCLFSQKFLY